MAERSLMLFAMRGSRELGEGVASRAGVGLSAHEERDFEDGESKGRPLESVREADVFVVASLHGDGELSVNDRLCRLLFFIGALKDAAAGRVTALVPYLCYARKDRRTKPRDPVTSRYVAALFEAVRVDSVLTLDVHNVAAFENAFRCRKETLTAAPLFARYFEERVGAGGAVAVSPDAGGMKRVEVFREALAARLGREVGSAFVEKYRSAGVLSGEAIVGDVGGKTAILLDDLVSTGTTLARAAAACRRSGASRVFAAVTHGVFTAEADGVLAAADLDGLVVTNTIPAGRRIRSEAARRRLETIDASGLLGEAVLRLHAGVASKRATERSARAR